MRVAVLGAGAWGTAMAAALAARHDTVLWARDAAQAAAIAQARCNARYLPEVALPPTLRVEADLAAACAHAAGGLLLLAMPMSGLRGLLQAVPAQQPALWLCKGFEAGSGLLGHEIARSLRPQVPSGVLSGPSFALEVARAQPTALVVASTSAELATTAAQALHGEAMRVYTSTDVVGVEVGGALKNVLTIATGMLDGLAATGEPGAPGLNARAALITRGLAEMTRLGLALGARAETFMGLSGLGDLVLTATGDLSRNRQLGLLLAQGLALPEALARLGHVAEGAYTARTAAERAQRLGVEMPITQAVVAVLEGRLQPRAAMAGLMSRQSRAES
ncbi:MAG: glycerol-3-phosphate dehydrogenase [Rubrivivax sp. SCN 71-131]|nr:MAG: glycerol-3-phosphate dehydrogenase [Rubrivivax sp. SCN 71-131]